MIRGRDDSGTCRRLLVGTLTASLTAVGLTVVPVAAAAPAPARPHPGPTLVRGSNVHLMLTRERTRQGARRGGEPQGKSSRTASPTSGDTASEETSSPSLHSSTATAIAGPAGAALTYRGGKVISNVHSVPVVYGGGLFNPEVTAPIGAVPSLAGMLDAVSAAGSPYLRWLSQYATPTQTIGSGDAESPHVITPDPARNGSTVTDAQIQTEIAAQIVSGALPAPQLDSAGRDDSLYTVFFRAGQTISTPFGSSGTDFCAYHGTIANVPGYGEVYYTVMPHFGALFCNDGTRDTFSMSSHVLGHELIEAITDPEVGLANATSDPTKIAWYDGANGEIADICAWRGYLATVGADGAAYNPSPGWANDMDACVVAPPVDGFTMTAPSTASMAKGSSVVIDVATAVDVGNPGPITVTSVVPNSTFFRTSVEVVAAGQTAHLLLRALPTAPTGPATYRLVVSSLGSRTHRAPITVTVGPLIPTSITSTNAASFTEGVPGSFLVTTQGGGGGPAPSLAVDAGSALPAGLSLTDNLDGTATLSGTPAPGTSDAWLPYLRSSNGVDPDSVQRLNLRVTGLARYEGPPGTSFAESTYNDYVLRTVGFPGSYVFLYSSLPTGLGSTNLTRGTLELSGTPASGTHGVYPLTLAVQENGFNTPLHYFTFTLTITGDGHTDVEGPLLSDVAVSPGVTNGGPLTVTATADDTTTGASPIRLAEVSVDADPVVQGYGLPLTGPDGTAVTASLTATIASLAHAGLSDGPHTLHLRAQDTALNWGPLATVPFVLDTTAPVASLTASPAANGAGWNTTDVTVTWHWSDGSGSGLDPSSCPGTSTSTGQGSAVVISGGCADLAGNVATAQDTVKVDQAPPVVTVTGVTAGTQYLLGAPHPGCSTSDALSGVATTATLGTALVGTAGVGNATATCTGGSDIAGNLTAPVMVAYTVITGFGGYLSPLPKATLAKPGASIPVKFRLTDGQGHALAPASAAALSAARLVTVSLTGPGIITPIAVTAGWDPRALVFQANLKTPTTVLTGTRNPYAITAREVIGGTSVAVPAVGSAVNPETVFFK